MTKLELISILIDKQPHLSSKVVESTVKEIFDLMSNALTRGERIEIRGFGGFSVRYRAAREARNPRTGELVSTVGKYAVHFKPGKELKDRVNNIEQAKL